MSRGLPHRHHGDASVRAVMNALAVKFQQATNVLDHRGLRLRRPVFVGAHGLAVRADGFLTAHQRDVADVRIKIVAAEVKGQMRVVESVFGHLRHHELVHGDIRAGRFAVIPREEIRPRLGIEIDAVEAQAGHVGNAPARRLAVAVKRLENFPNQMPR